MRRLLLIGVLVGTVGCARAMDRALEGARSGLAYDANFTEVTGDARRTAFLERRAEWFGVDIQYLATGHLGLHGAAGVSWVDDTGRHVRVDASLSERGRFEVLAHEIAHVFQPPVLMHAEADVFAELVAVEIAQVMGIDTSARASFYLQAYKSGFHVRATYAREIRYVVRLLTEGYR